MQIDERREGQIVILAPHGAWDAATAPAFKEQANALVAADLIRFAIDFSHVEFIDSSALGSLVSLYKKVKPTLDGDVKLFALAPDIHVIFRETRLDRVFQILPTLEEAIRSFPT